MPLALVIDDATYFTTIGIVLMLAKQRRADPPRTNPVNVSPSFVEANGLRFAYFEEGAGPLVLLVHGFPDTPQTWDAARPALASAGYRAVTPFTRGYAPTAIPADPKYDPETLGRDVLALIAALGETRATVVGHDWGATAAYSAAMLSPERLQRLVAVGVPHPASIRSTPGLLWRARHFLSLRRSSAEASVRAHDFAHVDALVQRWSPRWKVPPGETRAVKSAFREPGCLQAALGYYRAFALRVPQSQRVRIQVPTVCFAGASDGVIPVETYDRAAPWFTNGYEVVRMTGGHFMHREDPTRFVEQLVRVLRG